MSAALMHGQLAQAPPMPWTRMWHNSQALVVSVALHSTVVAFLVLGWSMEQSLPEPTPSTLKTRLVMLPAEPVVAPAAPEPVQVVAPAPVVEVKPEVVKPKVDPQIQARKLEQAVLARKRVEAQKQAQAEQREAAQVEAQRQQAMVEQARIAAADNARRAQQAAAAADVRQYLPISKQAPDYPLRALDKGIEGDCTVEYSVTPQGKVDNPKVVGNCHPAFIRPSLVAAATFRYQPRLVDGQPVTVPGVRNTFHYKIQ